MKYVCLIANIYTNTVWMKLPYCTKATKKKHVIWQIRAKITKRQKSANKRKPLLEQTPTKEYGWFDYRVFRLP